MHLGLVGYGPLYIIHFLNGLSTLKNVIEYILKLSKLVDQLDQRGGLSAESRVFCFRAQGGANNPPVTSKSTRGHKTY